jgi:hypothetical protein
VRSEHRFEAPGVAALGQRLEPARQTTDPSDRDGGDDQEDDDREREPGDEGVRVRCDERGEVDSGVLQLGPRV